MDTTMTDDDVKTIAQQVVEQLLPAIEKAIRQQARNPRPRPCPIKDHAIERLVRFVQNAQHYSKDRLFGRHCQEGLMPRSKLLKLVKLPAAQFDQLIDKALQDGRIEPCFAAHSRLPYSRLPCFRPGSAAQAPAKAPAQTPAQAPTQPAAPDYGPLDDPAQDAHEWDFATALAKARERDSWY